MAALDLLLGVGNSELDDARLWAVAVANRTPPGSSSIHADQPQQSQAAPDFTLPTVTGDRVHLNDLRGKVILLNFWATWCPPCQAEMPDLNALYREFGPTQNFVVLGVDVEEGQSAVEAFVRRNGITFPLALDTNGSVSNDRYHVRSLPTSMIIDREGNIRDTWLGQISKNAMIARLKRVW